MINMLETNSNFKIDRNNRIYCEADIPREDYKKLEPAEFKVDTGACRSSVSFEFLETLGYTEEDFRSNKFKRAVMTVAGGNLVEVYTTVLPQLKIGDNVF